MTPTFPSSASLSPRFHAPGRPQGSGWTGKLQSCGQDHVCIGGRGTGSRLAKQIAAPKQTSRVQSAAVARPRASANAAPAPQKLLLPPQERAFWAGGGPPAPVPSAKHWSREARPGTRAPWPLGPQKVKRFPLGDREPLGSAVPNLEDFWSPRRARGAAFCPVPEKPWRNGREGQRGRQRSGRGEVTTIPKCLGAAAELAQAEPGGNAGAGDTDRSSVRDALPDSFRTCTKRSRLPNTPPRLVGGWAKNAIPISQVEKLRFKRTKCVGWKPGFPGTDPDFWIRSPEASRSGSEVCIPSKVGHQGRRWSGENTKG